MPLTAQPNLSLRMQTLRIFAGEIGEITRLGDIPQIFSMMRSTLRLSCLVVFRRDARDYAVVGCVDFLYQEECTACMIFHMFNMVHARYS